MAKFFNGKNGTSVKLIIDKIKKDIGNYNINIENPRNIKDSCKAGKLSLRDCKCISIGLDFLSQIVRNGFNKLEIELLLGEKDSSKLKKELYNYKGIISNYLHKISKDSYNEYQLHKELSSLNAKSEILQAARNGVLLKQVEIEKTKEDGSKKKVLYDTSITPSEAQRIINDYYSYSEKLAFDRLNNCLGIGLGLAGAIGSIINNRANKDNKGNKSIITIGTTAIAGLKLLQTMLPSQDKEKSFNMSNQKREMIADLLIYEPISKDSKQDSIKNITDLSIKAEKELNRLYNHDFKNDLTFQLAVSLISGIFINKNTEIKDNGKIDGKSLSAAIINLQKHRDIASYFVHIADNIKFDKRNQDEFKQICKELHNIVDQMNEKVYPLEGAKNSFNSLSINNFQGKFYPKKDYETGNVKYALSLNIPEFSIKRGDVVLLSGESGVGKSTFLRFLKYGDINNRNAIKLDNGETVDNLGSEYITFNTNLRLGNQSNVLFQVTGKYDYADLSKNDQKRLKEILKDLKFESPDILEDLSFKKFSEFSTGEQKRLSLSKLFYRINDKASIIIVDEPVGNVQNNLIREQLKMIKKYAEKTNKMLILTTHRLDLAKDLVTKRYDIDEKGNLKEIPLKNKEELEH